MQLRINMKDVVSGLFLVLLALIGLWLNQDHSLGSARRMGPGYMPMLVFWIQVGLGTAVTLIGLFSGPDPLEKWTGLDAASLALGVAAGFITWAIATNLGPFFSQTYNGVGLGVLVGMLVVSWSAGWRKIGLICASMAVFALLLEKFGFFAALTGIILVASMAERTHTVRGVAGMLVFLLALCWWVFIYELDIRVNLWPQF
ncbi:hypothetical protein [Sabulicella rubraurantiaca]|uniref:hypothetical protein n=1 Tax=Sabulicella rubraurantiaca TaxID=2811429 RepID=UPI001A9775C9|nr:hypothetical protein [Sabulicella rubraurantiaca]